MDSDDETQPYEPQQRQRLRAVRELRRRDDLEVWDLEMTGKLAVDGRAIGDTKAQLFYIWGALSRELQGMLLPRFWNTLSSKTLDPQYDFLQYVRDTLEEPNHM